MIELQTGLPGSGKTLFTLVRIKAFAEKEKRTVYYSGISDLRLGWTELENPELWYKCPKDSVIVIDEAQRVFRPRSSASGVPEHVEKLETHRHLGIDLVLITQHPMLLDSNVRRLVGRHYHAVRLFGRKKSTVHEWEQCKENCDKSRKDALGRHDFFFPSKSFAWYKSAEAHTHKLRIPGRVWAMGLLPVVFFFAVWAFASWYEGFAKGPKEAPAVLPKAGSFVGELGSPSTAQKTMTVQEYVTAHAPRVRGLAYTAPIYDGITKPVEAPYPAACVVSESRGCRCYSQQGTVLDVLGPTCREIVRRGYFVAWDTTKGSRAEVKSGKDGRTEGAPRAPLVGPS